MKYLMIALSLLAMGNAVAGPSVSGGVIYYQQYEVCTNTANKATFTVAAVLKPENLLGTLGEGQYSTSLKCTEGNNSKSPVTGEENVWNCAEYRAGEGQLRIHINRNSAGVKYGIVYRLDILNRLAEIYKMKCDQQVSNK